MNDLSKLVLLLLGISLIVFSLTGFFQIQNGTSSRASIAYISSSNTPIPAQTEIPNVESTTTAAIAMETSTLPETATPVPALPTETPIFILPTATLASGFTQIAAATQPNTATAISHPAYPPPPPDFGGGPLILLGTHTVRANEYLFCIGRAYGVLPQAIAQASSIPINGTIFVGQVLNIPNTPWVDMPPGPICIPQFNSPYAPTPTPTPTTLAGLFYKQDASYSNLGKDHQIYFIFPNKDGARTNLWSVSPVEITTPEPVAETRIVRVELPKQMHVGESSQVRLTFNLETGQSTVSVTTSSQGTSTVATATPDSYRTVETSDPINIPDVFDEYRVFANARLDAAGFTYSPEENVEQEIILGKGLTWRWSIKPEDAEAQELIIKLRLVYKSKLEEIPPRPDEEIWSDSFNISVTRNIFQSLFGAQASYFAAFSLIMGIVASVASVWDKIPIKKRTTEKAYSPG